LAVHEARNGSHQGKEDAWPHGLAGSTLRRAVAERRSAGAGPARRRSAASRPGRLFLQGRPSRVGLPARAHVRRTNPGRHHHIPPRSR
jgi:hypothetical protein